MHLENLDRIPQNILLNQNTPTTWKPKNIYDKIVSIRTDKYVIIETKKRLTHHI